MKVLLQFLTENETVGDIIAACIISGAMLFVAIYGLIGMINNPT